MTRLLKLTAAFALFSACGQAQAAVYLSEAAFDAANPGLPTVSFTGLTTSLTELGATYSQDGLSFTGSNLYAVSTNYWASHDSLVDNAFGGFIQAAFSSVDAIGFYVGGNYGAGPITISFFNGATQVFTDTPVVGGALTAFSFYGVDGIGPITSVRLDATVDGFPSIGPITLGTAAVTDAVPEPATWAMMIAGFALVGGAMRRQRQRQTVRFVF